MWNNFIWSLVMPSSWLLFAIIYVFYCIQKGKIKQAKVVLIIWISLAMLISFVPIGDWLLAPLENTYPLQPNVKNPKAIVLLGGSEDVIQSQATGLLHLNWHGTRYITTINLAKTYPNAKIIVSGGVGHIRHESLTEASIAKDILLSAGIDEKRIILEDQSHTTIENALYTKRLLDSLSEQSHGSVILVTSASHMPRAVGLFCSAGVTNIVPYPTSFIAKETIKRLTINLPVHLYELNFGAHEWVGLLINWFKGRTEHLITQGC